MFLLCACVLVAFSEAFLLDGGVDQAIIIKPSSPDPADKVDTAGQYVPFYGYTVVSQLTQNLTAIEQFIKTSQFISKYVSPLPASSYHVTYFSIFTQRNVPDVYRPSTGIVPSNDFVRAFKALQGDMLAVQAKCESIMKDVSVTLLMRNISVGVSPGQTIHILVEPSHVAEIRRLQGEIGPIFNKTYTNPFHMTLGYLFKAIPQSELSQVIKEVQDLWRMLNIVYTLEVPNACYFEDMKEFKPVLQYFDPLL